MIRFLADEDFDGRIVRGLFRRESDFGLVRVQDIGLRGASDEKLLEWATDNDRIVLTHDKPTICSNWSMRGRISSSIISHSMSRLI